MILAKIIRQKLKPFCRTARRAEKTTVEFPIEKKGKERREKKVPVQCTGETYGCDRT